MIISESMAMATHPNIHNPYPTLNSFAILKSFHARCSDITPTSIAIHTRTTNSNTNPVEVGSTV